MDDLLTSLHVALPEGITDWLHLVPSGTFRGRDGRGPYVLRDPEAVIRASMADGKLPIDESHGTDFAMETGRPAPARGWIDRMEARQDGIWGHVEWTPTGQQLLTEKAYRGISPVFTTPKAGDGHVLQILRAALTNTPNLPALRTLHSTQGATTMDLQTQLRAAYGLPGTADDAAIVAAAKAAGAAIATHATTLAAHATTLTAIATAAALKAVKPEEMVVELQAQRAAMVAPATVVQLQTELAQLKADGAKSRAITFVDGAIKAGKPINPVREQYIAMHMADAAGVEKLINALPSIKDGGVTVNLQAGGGEAGDGLTNEDKMTCTRMGLDPKKFAEQKKKRLAAADGETA